MKLKVKNKKLVISCIVILIVAAIIGLYFYNKVKNSFEDSIKDSAYIDIWRDNSMDADIDLYSTGSGANEKLYLGSQPVHYLINKNGEIYTYQASSYKNKMTGKRDPATVKHIKTISNFDLQKLENDLKLITENNNDNSISWTSPYWYIKINNNSARVNVNVKSQVLDKYF